MDWNTALTWIAHTAASPTAVLGHPLSVRKQPTPQVLVGSVLSSFNSALNSAAQSAMGYWQSLERPSLASLEFFWRFAKLRNSCLVQAATIFGLEIYKVYINPQASDRRIVNVSTVLLGRILPAPASLRFAENPV